MKIMFEMKKISALLLAAALSSAILPAQNTVATPDSVKINVTAALDSTKASIALAIDGIPLDEQEPSEAPAVFVEDGKWTVDYDGQKYRLSKLVEDSENVANLGEGFQFNDLDAESVILKDNMGIAVAIVSIVFGLPCLTIIVGLIVILYFALRRNRGRNQVINNAIEHDYQLPDSFYLSQKGTSGSNMPTRDSRKFYSATTLMAIGLSLIAFAIFADASFFFLAGGIPFLIGVGQLIGYYCVPNTSPRNMGPQSLACHDAGYAPGQQPYMGYPNFTQPQQNQYPQYQQPFSQQSSQPQTVCRQTASAPEDTDACSPSSSPAPSPQPAGDAPSRPTPPPYNPS